MSCAHKYLSVSDLLLVEGFKEAYGADDKEAIHKILENNGMDVSQGIDEVFCQHRNLRDQIVTCVRYEGFERLDDAWIKSGCASMDAIIASCPDASKRVELRMLDPRGSLSDMFEED